tara:strand:- start:83 stop:412 length:330 start_codon:yes stop_codon:yes gene_type:complete
MEPIITFFSDQPVYLIVAVILAIVILFSFIKKLIKLAMVVAAAFVLYIAYLMWTGKEVPVSYEDVTSRVKEKVEEGIQAGKKAGQELIEKSKEKIIEEAEKKLEKITSD